MENIKRITEYLRNNEYISSPHQAAEDQAILAGEYAFIMGQLETILMNKPSIWNKVRIQVKSDKAAERIWESSEEGVNEMGFRLRAKSCEKMMSALKTLVRLAEGETKNLT